MSISMDQFQAVSAVPQYIDNPFLTAAGTSLPTAQSIVQWPPTAYRHTAPTIDVSAVPRQQRPRLNASLSLSLSFSLADIHSSAPDTHPAAIVHLLLVLADHQPELVADAEPDGESGAGSGEQRQ